MSTSNIKAVYPSGVFQWTDKVDQVSVVEANDINSVAAEVEAVETTLGTNILRESSPPTGNPVTYTTVSARISDAMNGNNLPVVSCYNANFKLGNKNANILNNYKSEFDPYSIHNGVDITVPANGWFVVFAHQTFPWWNTGYDYMALCLNGTSNILTDFLIDWQFAGNVAVAGGTTPRWQQFGKRSRIANCYWQGLLHKGDRISVVSENGTSNDPQTITNGALKLAMLRQIPSNMRFTSGG